VSEAKRITVDAGQYVFKSESTFQSSGRDELTAAVGFVKRTGVVGATKQVNERWAWLSTWGPVQRGTGGHGDLGGGAIVDRSRLVDIRETEDHYLALITATPGEPVTAYVGAGWTAAGDLDRVEDWWEYLDGFAARLAQPVEVIVVGR
jgi:pectinesterase